MKRRFFLSAAAALLCAVLWLPVGCENNSDADSANRQDAVFEVSPASLTLGAGTNTVILEVLGGHAPFAWTMSAPDLATLSGNEGFSRLVNYTRKGAGVGANTLEVRDDRGWIAHAVVIHE